MAAAPSVQGQTLGEALNATNLTWTTSGTSGASGWSAQTTKTHDGVAAAKSGTVSFPGSTSTLQTTVTGPGKITFWWNIDFGNAVAMSFTANGVLQTNMGFVAGTWRKETIFISSGTQTLRWIVTPSGYNGSALLDEVAYTAGVFAPEITQSPWGQSQVPGLDTVLTVSARGTPPLAYQWQFNALDIAVATNSIFVVSNTQATNLGNYRVIVTNIAGAVTSSIAPLEFGEVAAWGQYELVGRATATNGLNDIKGIAAGGANGLALRHDGSIVGWGVKPFGELSYGELTIPEGLSNSIGIATGSDSSMALWPSGDVIVWGGESLGATSPTNLPPGLSNVVAVSLGDSHALALKSDGTLVAWGNSSFAGQTNGQAGLSNVVAIDAGIQHNLAVKSDGTVAAWGGYNSRGELNIPAGLSNVVAVAAGWFHSVALKSDGTVRAWGDNLRGQCNVPSSVTNVVAIAAGNYFSVALKADGTVVAWGNNDYGQNNVPAKLTNVVAIAAGYSHALALVGSGPPVAQATMSGPALSTNGFRISITSQSGRVYRLEYKTSLSDPDWTALPLVAGTGTNLVLVDPTATNSQRVYRVRRW